MESTTNNQLRRFTLRGLKTINTDDGYAFSVTLCLDGKPVASASNDGNGGCNRWDWIGRRPNGSDLAATGAETLWLSIVAAMPPVSFEGQTLTKSSDWVLDELISDFENDKRLRRLAKTRILFRLAGDEVDSLRQISKAALAARFGSNAEILGFMRGKYGSALVEIVNARFEAGLSLGDVPAP